MFGLLRIDKMLAECAFGTRISCLDNVQGAKRITFEAYDHNDKLGRYLSQQATLNSNSNLNKERKHLDYPIRLNCPNLLIKAVDKAIPIRQTT